MSHEKIQSLGIFLVWGALVLIVTGILSIIGGDVTDFGFLHTSAWLLNYPEFLNREFSSVLFTNFLNWLFLLFDLELLSLRLGFVIVTLVIYSGVFRIIKHFYKDTLSVGEIGFISFSVIPLFLHDYQGAMPWSNYNNISLALILWAYYFSLVKKYSLSDALLVLCLISRISNILPLFIVLLSRDERNIRNIVFSFLRLVFYGLLFLAILFSLGFLQKYLNGIFSLGSALANPNHSHYSIFSIFSIWWKSGIVSSLYLVIIYILLTIFNRKNIQVNLLTLLFCLGVSLIFPSTLMFRSANLYPWLTPYGIYFVFSFIVIVTTFNYKKMSLYIFSLLIAFFFSLGSNRCFLNFKDGLIIVFAVSIASIFSIVRGSLQKSALIVAVFCISVFHYYGALKRPLRDSLGDVSSLLPLDQSQLSPLTSAERSVEYTGLVAFINSLDLSDCSMITVGKFPLLYYSTSCFPVLSSIVPMYMSLDLIKSELKSLNRRPEVIVVSKIRTEYSWPSVKVSFSDSSETKNLYSFFSEYINLNKYHLVFENTSFQVFR